MGTFLSIVGVLVVLSYSEAFNSTNPPITVINGHRGFQMLHMTKQKDYFISTKTANVQDAIQTCQSIGSKYHLVAFEDEEEYATLLPYLRSLEFKRVWTGGRKEMHNSSAAYEWTQPSPPFPMDFVNFPSPSAMASLIQRMSRSDPTKDLMPRCKNGFLTPKCSPGNCQVTLDPCSTVTPDCTIDQEKPCSVIRPDCGATCNNCTVEQPTCFVVQKPCTVVTKPCIVTKPPCSIITPPCETVRPPCITVQPPCEVTTPKPCPTTTKKPCGTVPVCQTVQPPCKNGKCGPPVTTCRPIFDCEPEICFPGAIICPSPVITCPEEETVCPPPVLNCPEPTPHCPPPEVDCPLPTAQCTKPKITCDSPEVNCPGIIVTCPAPSFSCPSPIVNCPPPNVECEETIPCEYPNPPPPCPYPDEDEEVPSNTTPMSSLTTLSSSEECDYCEPSGCVALRRETGFKWKVEKCSEEFHFICEGKP